MKVCFTVIATTVGLIVLMFAVGFDLAESFEIIGLLVFVCGICPLVAWCESHLCNEDRWDEDGSDPPELQAGAELLVVYAIAAKLDARFYTDLLVRRHLCPVLSQHPRRRLAARAEVV